MTAMPPEAPRPPVEPDPLACCGNGCGEACVWTLYRRAQQQYEAALRAWQAAQAQQ